MSRITTIAGMTFPAIYNARRLANASMTLQSFSRADMIEDKITLSEAAKNAIANATQPNIMLNVMSSDAPNIEPLAQQLENAKRATNLFN